MRGGTIFFDDKVRVIAGLDTNGHHAIWFETTVEFDESIFEDLGYTCRTKDDILTLYFNKVDDILAQYSNEKFVITKSISNPNHIVVQISTVDNEGFNTIMHVSLITHYAPKLCIPLFDMSGKRGGHMVIDDICLPKPETIIRYMNDVARAKFSGEKVNNLVINSFILPDDTVYVREVQVDYSEGKSGVFVRKLDESDCIYEEARKFGTYMTERRFKDVFCK